MSRRLSILLSTSLLMAQQQPAIPDYAQTPRAQIPEKLTWKIQDLFPSQEAWRKEFEALKPLAKSLDELAPQWTNSPQNMLAFLDRLSEIQQRARKVGAYASLQSDMDMADPTFHKMKGETQSFFVEFGSRLAFMEPDVLKLGDEGLEAFLKSEPKLAPYRVGLKRILRGKEHVLPEGEQRVASLTGLFSNVPSKVSGLLNDVEIPRPEITLKDGSKLVLNQANYQKTRTSKVLEDRRKAMESYWLNQKQYESSFAALLDGAVKSHLFNAKIKKHPSCLEAALFSNDIDPAVYRNLVSTVRANLAPLHRLLKLRKKLLKLDDFRYGDIYVSPIASVNKLYTYEQAQKLVLDSMAPMGPDYAAGLKAAFDGRWIDVYPNKGKQSGAYSSGVFGVHPYVKMNYDGQYSNLSTLSHELGHALHSWFSDRTQPYPMAQYPIFLAEVASTFNEALLTQHLLKTEKDAQFKLFVLDEFLERMRATLYRQTLFADFELAMHEHVESGKTLTADWLNTKYLELTRLYYGHDQGVMKVEDYIQTEWSGIPHFYYNFYVFQYSTGIAASLALSEQALKDPASRDRYLGFLKAGGTKFPLEILKDAGVDMSSPKAVEQSIQLFDRFVGEMEKLAEK